MASPGIRKVLTCDQKKIIIKLFEEKVKQTEIAKLFDVNKSTVCCIIRRYQHRGNVENRHRSGRHVDHPRVFYTDDNAGSVDLCVQHSGRDATPSAGSSVPAETCFTK